MNTKSNVKAGLTVGIKAGGECTTTKLADNKYRTECSVTMVIKPSSGN